MEDPSAHSEHDTATNGARYELQSPSFLSAGDSKCHAYEMKFLVSLAEAEKIQYWARRNLQLDPHANPQANDSYEIHTLYLDTLHKDMFHRRDGYRNEKYRLRNYSNSSVLYLEHKQRRGDRVAKTRDEIDMQQWHHFLARNGEQSAGLQAYKHALQAKQLLPSCRMSYCRAAYMARDEYGMVRLTLDHQIRGEVVQDWPLQRVEQGTSILNEHMICELKFRETLPHRFKALIAEFNMEPQAVSKYRRFLSAALHILPETDSPAGENSHG